MPYGAVDYRMMSRQMVDAVVSLGEVQRFSKGLFSWVGFETKWIPYKNVERTIGTTKWSFWGLFKYAIDGFASFSIAPLRILSAVGFFISFVAFIYILVTLIQTLVFGIEVKGYFTTLSATLFMGGIIELSIGILGEYISRIYMESKRRPIYLVKDTNINKDTTDNEADTEDEKEADKKDNKNNKSKKAETAKEITNSVKEAIEKNSNKKDDDNSDESENEEPEKVEYDLSYFE